VRGDDPTRWQETELGRALVALRPELNWLAVSAGMKAAGEFDDAARAAQQAALAELREAAAGYSVSIDSGRGGRRAEARVDALSDLDLLFDLYCIAVLEKHALGAVVATARDTLRLIRALENPEPLVNLSAVVSARLRGETPSSILGTQGLVLRNFSLAEALSKLRALADKAAFTIPDAHGGALPLEKATLEDFRRAVLADGPPTARRQFAGARAGTDPRQDRARDQGAAEGRHRARASTTWPAWWRWPAQAFRRATRCGVRGPASTSTRSPPWAAASSRASATASAAR
jgi:hypothetical protein